MEPGTIKLLIIWGFVAAVAGTGIYYLVMFMKGSIRIVMQRDAFSQGETVEGSFELEAKKEIRGNELIAAVVATETRAETGHNGHVRERTREIYRSSQSLERGRVYPAGYKADYNFKIALPANSPVSDEPVGISTMRIGPERRLEWDVVVRLDADGVDLVSKRRIYVSW